MIKEIVGDSKVSDLRKDFPTLQNNPGLVYLDNAASSQTPSQVLEKVKEFYHGYRSNVNRGMYDLSQRASIEYDKAREKVSDFIGVDKEEVVFTKNTTEGINLVMYGYGLSNVSSSDNIVVSKMDHHSNFVVWQQLAKMKNADLRVVDIKQDGSLDMDDLIDKIDSNTKVISLVHASNVLGTINDIKEISDIIREKASTDSIFIVDGSQAVPHQDVNPRDLGVDFYSFSGHKMLGPTGTGVLYGKKSLLESMNPFMYGGGMIDEVSIEESSWASTPEKFEAGTPNISGSIGLGRAIDYLENIGMNEIQEYEERLTDYLINELRQVDDVTVYGNTSERAGIVSFNLDGVHAHDVSTICNKEYNVSVRAGHHCCQPLMNELNVSSTVRASLYFYNNRKDVDKLVKSLEKAKEVLK